VTTSVTWQRFLGTVAALVFGLVIALAPPKTTASASTYTYDGPTVARIGAHAIDNAGATPFEVSDVAEQSAWALVTARGTSTTPVLASVATNTVDPNTVRFSQDSASHTFRDGRSVSDMAADLKSGDLLPGNVHQFGLSSETA
jgi:hypothetical protein